MMLIAARELGVAVERIRYRRPSTSVIPDSGTTVASRGTIMGGGAVTLAAQDPATWAPLEPIVSELIPS